MKNEIKSAKRTYTYEPLFKKSGIRPCHGDAEIEALAVITIFCTSQRPQLRSSIPGINVECFFYILRYSKVLNHHG